MDYEKLALEYHSRRPRGKIFTGLGKPMDQQYDLSLAYTPGVAGPCREIAKDEDQSFVYTGRGNLVAVVSNGSAVLGLGAIGPHAAKPVMEGKAMLFKKYANIDVFDLEMACDSTEAFVEAVAALEPTFGGINLEDIKAPECFYIEEQLRARMKIPVFHDDQHGTAIIAGAAFLNALEVTGRAIKDVKVVFSGSGAAAIASANLFLLLGVREENLILTDSKGTLNERRTDLNEFKQRFVRKTPHDTMAEALVDADVFLGVSTADILTAEMVKTMAPNPIIFALSNPNPEIRPDVAKAARPDAIVATGRTDYPNQVNNVLGFPFIFRGALDVRATTINDEMKLAAVHAIARLAKEDVTSEVLEAYKTQETYVFGRDYLIPKPVDSRVLLRVAPAVAEAAMRSGVARIQIDINKYCDHLDDILGPERRVLRMMKQDILKKAQLNNQKPRIYLSQGADPRVIRAAKQLVDDGYLHVVIGGKREEIMATAGRIGITGLDNRVELFDTEQNSRSDDFAHHLFELRKRKGVTLEVARQMVRTHNYAGAYLLRAGDVDGLVVGIGEPYSHAISPLLHVIGTEKNQLLAGVYLMIVGGRLLFLADCTVNVAPTAHELASIALQAGDLATHYSREKIRIALLSYSCFGSKRQNADVRLVQDAVDIVKARAPHGYEVEGEMQADVALDMDLMAKDFPFSSLTGPANVLVFPNLAASNIAYKMISRLAAGAVQIGPVLLGMKKPANVIQRGAPVTELVNLAYATAHQSVLRQEAESKMNLVF